MSNQDTTPYYVGTDYGEAKRVYLISQTLAAVSNTRQVYLRKVVGDRDITYVVTHGTRKTDQAQKS